jgi:hypothetical protein
MSHVPLRDVIDREVAESGVHELVSEFEFRLRFTTLLVVSCASRSAIKPNIQLRRNLGLGGWHDLLNGITRDLAPDSTLNCRMMSLGDEVDRIWKTPISGAPGGISHLKPLRDYLGHGGRVDDSTQDLADTLRIALAQLSTAVSTFLTGAACFLQDDAVTLLIEAHEISLSPFVTSKAGRLMLYANGGPGKPTYFSAGKTSAKTVLQELESELKNYFSESSELAPAVEVYLDDLVEDLAAFSEQQDRPVPIADSNNALRISWRRATSSGTEERIDEFRLGPDGVRQWFSQDKWFNYSVFLKKICNWKTVAARLSTSFQNYETHNASIEAEYLGNAGSSEVLVPVRVRVADFDGGNVEKTTASMVFETIDDHANGNVGVTRITFFNGTAGSGKTHTMLRAAIERADQIAKKEVQDGDEPLYLYVRSTGRVLDDLSTVVEAAVAATRNLTDAGVKALVRNGLLTLFIDGFDELLGNSTYGDALGSLRPWLKSLGGRGTLVVSARSSYYLNEYKSSVAKASASVLAPVQHRVAEILPWSQTEVEDYLTRCGFDSSALKHLLPEESELVKLPFFARIVAGLTSEKLAEPGFSLIAELLQGYVQRESTKLTLAGDDEQAMISPDELELLFENAALLMAGEAERQISSDDLCLAAEDTLAGGLDSRPRLEARLPNLCGIGVDSGESVKRFGFQHEIYFDEFFAARVARYANNGDDAQFVAALGYDNWRSATLGSVMRRVDPVRLKDLLALAQRSIVDGNLMGVKLKNFRTNSGALWSSMMRGDWETSEHVKIHGVDIVDDMDLTKREHLSISITDSRIGCLRLPKTGQWKVNLEGSHVQRLEYMGTSVSGLSGVEDKAITSLLTSTELIDTWAKIADALVLLGISSAKLKVVKESTESYPARMGKRFLYKLVERGSNAVVLLENRTFEEGDHSRSAWEGSDANLTTFVRALERASFAECVSFSAKGPKKLRLIFKVSLEALLAECASDEVRRFWASV